MKKTAIPAYIILFAAVFAAVGSRTFLRACTHDDGSFGACHWACMAALGESGLTAVLAVLALPLRRERRGLYLAMLPASLLGLMTPGTLIPLCKSPAMRCRMVMQPAMMILFSLMGVFALAGWLLSRKEGK
ncbi:MAG: DUF4418 family protein [Clostridia bacterium]|nr:DUF4418 family protein [Clostridia bacterium]